MIEHKNKYDIELAETRRHIDGITNTAPVLLSYIDTDLKFKFGTNSTFFPVMPLISDDSYLESTKGWQFALQFANLGRNYAKHYKSFA